MTVAQQERAALVATFRALSPDAPTLCEGWDARDLAAHLVVRERRLDAAPGILIPTFADYTERVRHQVSASTDWDVLVDQVADGPPLYSPFKLLDPIANVAEMFIHHEDLRRARPDWEPRPLDNHALGGTQQAGGDGVMDVAAQIAGEGDSADPTGRHTRLRGTAGGGRRDHRHRGSR